MKANLSTTFKTWNESAWSVIVILPIHINLQWGWLLFFLIRNKFLLAASTMVIKCLWPLVLCGCGSTDALGERRKMGCGDRLCCWRLNHNDLHLFRGRGQRLTYLLAVGWLVRNQDLVVAGCTQMLPFPLGSLHWEIF